MTNNLEQKAESRALDLHYAVTCPKQEKLVTFDNFCAKCEHYESINGDMTKLNCSYVREKA